MTEFIGRSRPSRELRIPTTGLFDPDVAQKLWDGLPQECRRDRFDKTNMPTRYSNVVMTRPSGITAAMKATGSVPSWTSWSLNMRDLPGPMVQELAWLVHREAELGLRIHPLTFNGATRGLRMATQHGGPAARSAQSLLQLTPEEWARHVDRARMRGQDIGATVSDWVLQQVRRWQDELVYPYHRGPWWRLNVWNPLLDSRIPQRENEPSGRSVVNFAHLTSPWLREATKWWLSQALESGRYSWSSLKTRSDGLKWLQRHITATSDQGPVLAHDPDDLRGFVRAFLERVRSHRVTRGSRAGQPLAGNPHRQILVAVEQFYVHMVDHRREAARLLDEPRWMDLTPRHGTLFRPGDKPRMTNRKTEDMVLEDEVVDKITRGAELLARPQADGGLDDLAAFHALMLLIRTGRRISEVLLMDFQPLSPLIGAAPAGDREGDVMVARISYRQTKVQSLQPPTIPVDAEVVAIIRAQQEVSRRFAQRMGWTSQDPRYLFLRTKQNRNCQHPYAAASLHGRLAQLSERLGITDSQQRPVAISRTHRFRHTAATNLLNAGVPLHVVMRYFGHQSPEMTMHYAVTLSQTAEKEFLRFKKVTTDGRPVENDPSDLFDLLQLDQRADRILPNGWCMLPPKQSCNRGNACLTCDKFATDASHAPELNAQLNATQRLVETRQAAFLARFGTPMSNDNVWLAGRHDEITSLRGILLAVEAAPRQGVRGAGSPTITPARDAVDE